MTIKEVLRRMDFGNAIQRWPVASVISVITSFILLSWIYQEGLSDQDASTYLRTVLSLYLGFLVAIIAPLALGKAFTKAIRLVITGFCTIVVGVIWYILLPSDASSANHQTYWLVYAYPLQIVILHLLISVAAFWGDKSREINFRNWNVNLLRIVFEGLLFFAVFMLGLSLALLALEHLFGFDINEKAYLYLLVLLLGVFHPWFVLSKTSTNPDEEIRSETTGGFRILTQYVLIPIVILYMVILYLYGVKIAIEGSLPQGWLGKLSLGFCSVSLLTFVLNSQLKEHSSKKISHLFHRWLPIVLVLPIGLLIIAVGRRIQDYGITENRYLVEGIAAWLLLTAISYSLKRHLSIKWIPISLAAILAFQLISGPINIFNTTIKSQEKRLKLELEQTGLLNKGILSKRVNQDPNIIDLSSLRFLSNRIELEGLPYFNSNNIDWSQLTDDENQLSFVMEQLNLEAKENSSNKEYIYFKATQLESFDISGYDTAYPFNTLEFPNQKELGISKNQLRLSFTLNGNLHNISASELHTLYTKRDKGLQHKPFLISDSASYKIFITEFTIESHEGDYKIDNCIGILFSNSKK